MDLNKNLDGECKFNTNLDEIKEQIVNDILIATLVFIAPVVISSIFMIKIVGFSYVIVTTFILFILMILLYIFRKKVTTNIKVIVLISSLVILSLADFLSVGMLSLGPLSLFTACALVPLFFNKKITNIFFFSSVFYVLIIAILVVFGIIKFDFDIVTLFYDPSAWATTVAGFALLGGVVTVSIRRITNFMACSMLTLSQKNIEINRSNIKLTNAKNDLSEQNRLLIDREKTIRHLIYFDNLTDLPNRENFKKHITSLILDTPEEESGFVIYYLDLDDFKKINDLLGHSLGDEIIYELGRRLNERLIRADLVARMAGDEFAIVYKGNFSNKEILERGNKIQNIVLKDIVVDTIPHYVSCSIGATVYPEDGTTYKELLKNADTAMTEAKWRGKKQFIIFHGDMKKVVLERAEMERDLRDSMHLGEIQPYFQAKIDVKTERIIGFEGLARWISPKWGVVSPNKFIPLMEDTGLIVHYGEIMLNRTLMELSKFNQAGFDDITMAVNISPVQFAKDNIVEKIKQTLKINGILPHYLEVEITESLMIDDFDEVTRILHEISDHNVSIALDDFGTGYSSLSYLRRLPIQTLKVDKSFINSIKLGEPDVFLSSIVNMAHAMGFKVVAEGVETKEQMQHISSMGCDIIQGFYYSKPVPASEALELLKKMNS
ncbi:MAG: EAL domain-containing protein [Spirochaetaceae bacterium]